MDAAVTKHLGKDIKEKTRLTGGYTFETWMLVLSDNTKVVFRTRDDFVTGGSREIIIADVLERERFFHSGVNKELGRVCPEVYVVDGSREYYDKPYCIMEYIEGAPLSSCYDSFDGRTQCEISFKIGELAARIGALEIENTHPYVGDRGSWEEYISQRLRERLTPLLKNGVITQGEIDEITSGMRRQKAAKTNSFLHLDMRRVNMIYNGGAIFLVDAENCEFGDPLYELAVIDVGGELGAAVTEGYGSVCGYVPNLSGGLYRYYFMERHALVLDVFMNIVRSDWKATEIYLRRFCEARDKLIGG